MTTVEEVKRTLAGAHLDDWFEVHDWLGKLIDSHTLTDGVREPRAAYESNPPLMSFEDYLEFSEHGPLRYEYINGCVRAISPGSFAHARVTMRLVAAIQAHLHGGPCEAFASIAGLQIRWDTDEFNYIPDVIVACNPDVIEGKWICNPKLVAEVISPSTRQIDEYEKATNYRRPGTMEEILLLEQSLPKITVFRRTANWRPQIYSGTDGVLELRSLSVSIPLAQIYAGVLPAG